MINIELNKEINGKQLVAELETAGVVVEDILRFNNNILSIAADEKHTEIAITIVNNHVPVFAEPTIIEKLESIGLSVDELKEALGL
jgi:hypothetical protein